MTKKMLKKYAELIVKVGANVQKGQDVFINASADQYEFVTYLTEYAYKSGARQVLPFFNYQPISKLKYRHETLKTLSKVNPWVVDRYKFMAEKPENIAMIHIISDDPDGLNGINHDKVSKANQAFYPIIKPYRDEMENKYQWTIAALPSVKWAKKVFFGDTKSVAMKKLWDAILSAVHVSEINDPIDEWKKHNESFLARRNFLNSKKFDTLEYKSANGTDFKVGFMEKSCWQGGSDTTIGGIVFNPNMPTEELFCSPKKGVAEGTVVATKPLSYNGVLIENFSITFKDGKAISCKADKNQAVLEKMIAMDEGASYLGECALIPKNSPINESGILFYETLFDENASCHLALGRGFADTIEGFQSMSKAETEEMGLNDSM
ncbi:MAG: aminopeptidase, partial [Clostridia bacterium]